MLAAAVLLLVQSPALGETSLLRSFSTTLDSLPGDGLRWAIISPEITTVFNSTLPFSLNDGALWAGRGWNQRVRAGARVTWGRFQLVLAPEIVSSANQPYAQPPSEVELPRPAGRSPYSTPWHVGAYSIDAPLRFGQRGFTSVDPGQSTAAFDLGAISVGVSTENEWWGPGIRNAIVLSDNAAGIWRAFVRTRPLHTGIGSFSARWFLGGLFESPHFDSIPGDDRRSITALAATWTPAGAPNLTLGFARAVYAPLRRWSGVVDHTFDVLRGRGLRRVPGDTTLRPSRDQVFSLFGRWVFPADGFAVHAEWARNALPGSLRELLVSPNHTEGYTLGLEWAASRTIRAQAEVTYLEKSPAYRNEHEETWYTSGASPQGYTQRGQVLGAAIGPGASSQWVAVDYVVPTWRAGLFLGRIRWDNDALYLFPSTIDKRCAHDVSLFGGARARWGLLDGSLILGRRLNPFYRTAGTCDGTSLGNTTLELRFTP